MRSKVMAATAVIAAAAASAWAGRALYYETTVDPAARTAYGSLHDTRASADAVQSIGCNIQLAGGVATTACEAINAAGVDLYCWSNDPEIVKVAQSLTDRGYLYFRCDASYRLNYLYVSKSSLYLP